MEKKKFNKLVKSIKQAGKIKRGEPLEDDLPLPPLKSMLRRSVVVWKLNWSRKSVRTKNQMVWARNRRRGNSPQEVMETSFLKIVDSIPWREAFPEYREEDLPGVSLLGARTKEGMTQTRLAELTGI
jgi:hypothetical protein